MKRITLTLLALLMALCCAFGTVGCEKTEDTTAETLAEGEEIEASGLWADATYRSDVTLGEGEKTVSFTVEAEGKMITITLKTDKATLEEAMLEHNLIAYNNSDYFNVLNGMLASWEKDQAYWAFYNGDQYMMVGVGEAPVEGEVNYRFVYTK